MLSCSVSWLILCNPMDCSLPSSSVHGILQARILEWVSTSFSNIWRWKVKVKSLSRVRLFTNPRTAAYQAPPSMRFSRQEYWNGLPLPSPIKVDNYLQNILLKETSQDALVGLVKCQFLLHQNSSVKHCVEQRQNQVVPSHLSSHSTWWNTKYKRFSVSICWMEWNVCWSNCICWVFLPESFGGSHRPIPLNYDRFLV